MRIPNHVMTLVAERAAKRPLELSEGLPVVREMLGMLDTLTIAGRRHLMTKMIDFVELQAQSAVWRGDVPNHEASLALLIQLRKESERLVPDSGSFVRRAERLINLLTAGLGQTPKNRSGPRQGAPVRPLPEASARPCPV